MSALKCVDTDIKAAKMKVRKDQAIILFFLVVLFSSMGCALVFAFQYYRIEQTVNDPVPSKPAPQSPPTEIDVVENPDGSKNYTITIFETIVMTTSLTLVAENQVSATGMETSARVYRWAHVNIDLFEDVRKERDKVRSRLKWMELKSGLRKSIRNAKRVFKF